MKQEYKGTDIKDYVNHTKFHRTANDAFKGVDYANWIEADYEMSDMKLFVMDMITCVIPLLVIGCFIIYSLFKLGGIV